MTSVEVGAAVPLFPMARECPYQPPPGYADLRGRGPLSRVRLPSGQLAWVVTGHAEARTLFADPRLSVDRSLPGYPRMHDRPVNRAAMTGTRTFVDMDDPEHRGRRRILIPHYSVPRIRSLRPGLSRDAERLAARLVTGPRPAELFSAFAVPMSAAAICRHYGVPDGDRALFESRLTVAATDHRSGGPALHDLLQYLDGWLTELAAGGAGDPAGAVPALVRGPLAAGRISRPELLNTLMMLVVSGNENLANMLALGVLTLVRHPAELAAVRGDPRLLRRTVDELLRYLSVADTVPRLATADVPIAGLVIRAGDGVVLPTAALNRDHTAFAEPDRFDVRRRAGHHLAFGYGVHQCLGQNLARATLETALAALLVRLPGLRLAVPDADVPVRGAVGVQGVVALPVDW